MNASARQRPVGLQPNVRSACESCHERKIRCIESDQGGPCESCQSKKLSCFFLPRYRSGRRPAESFVQETIGSATLATNRSSGSSHIAPVQTGRIGNRPLEAIASNGSDPFGWNWTPPARHYPSRSHIVPISDLDITKSNSPTADDFNIGSSMIGENYSDMTTGEYHNVQHRESSTYPALDMASSSESATSFPSSDSITLTDKELGERDFAMLLRYCTNLQSHIARTTDLVSSSSHGKSVSTAALTSTLSITQVLDMLGDVDSSCNFIFGIYGQGIFSKSAAQLREDLDYASVSLTNALILKIFRICDIVLTCNLLKKHGFDDMLLHKRLDLNITQVKIVTGRIQKSTQDGLSLSRDIAMNALSLEEKLRSSSRR